MIKGEPLHGNCEKREDLVDRQVLGDPSNLWNLDFDLKVAKPFATEKLSREGGSE